VALGCVACVAGLAGVWTGLRKPKSFRSGGKRSATSGWTWGSSGGGSSSGGGFSSGDGGGGGFGGGSSGGGGASGSW